MTVCCIYGSRSCLHSTQFLSYFKSILTFVYLRLYSFTREADVLNNLVRQVLWHSIDCSGSVFIVVDSSLVVVVFECKFTVSL